MNSQYLIAMYTIIARMLFFLHKNIYRVDNIFRTMKYLYRIKNKKCFAIFILHSALQCRNNLKLLLAFLHAFYLAFANRSVYCHAFIVVLSYAFY